jgi:O-antigen ligase/Tfp pilus assembly protein PilF
VLGLLFALPVFSVPGQLVEGFEFAKVSLLVTGALVLAAWWFAAEASRIGSAGVLPWVGRLPGRVVAASRRDPIGASVALFVLSGVASTVASIRPALSLFGAPQSHAGLRTVVALAAIYYASRSLASKSTWFFRVAQVAGAAAAVAAAYALFQVAGVDPFTLTWNRELAFQGTRASSTLGHANKVSAFLTMCLPLIVWLAARSASRAARIAWLGLTGLSLFVIAASLSRGGWLGVIAATLAALLLALASARRPPRSWGLIAVGIVVAVLILPLATPMRAAFLSRVQQVTDLSAPTSRTRLELWGAGLRMARDHPVLGVGVDAYVAAFPRYRTTKLTQIEWGGTPSKAHNDAIQILATQGIFGGLTAFAIVLLTAQAVWRVARRGSPETRGAAVAAGAALVGYVVPNLVGFASVATSALAAALAGWVGRTTPVAAAHEGTQARSFWSLASGLALAVALWFALVVPPLRAEMFAAEAMRASSGSQRHGDFLARAATAAPWDPRYSAELGRSFLVEGLRQRDSQTQWDFLVRARDALTKSVAAAPENSENQILLAGVMSAQAASRPVLISRSEVRDAFRHAVTLDPLNPVVLVAAERGLLAAGLDEDARELALRCAIAYPDYAPPLADLGAIALNQGRTAAAVDTLKLAVRRLWRRDVTGAAHAWNDLARASLSMREFAQARDAADSALVYYPGLSDAYGVREAAKRYLLQEGRAPASQGNGSR